MKHLSFKTEVFLVTGAWLIACGLEVALYFTATTPTARFLSILVLVLVLMLISIGWYVWNAIQISIGQKTLKEAREQIEERNEQVEEFKKQIESHYEQMQAYKDQIGLSPEQMKVYERIQENIDEVREIVSRAQSL